MKPNSIKIQASAIVLCFTAVLLSCANPTRIGSGILYLYSWREGKGGYAFVLVQKSDNDKFFSTFNRRLPHIRGIANLRQELAKLPPGTGVAWRDDRDKGLIFPPEHIRNRIAKAAASHGVTVEIVPTIYD